MYWKYSNYLPEGFEHTEEVEGNKTMALGGSPYLYETTILEFDSVELWQ